MHELSDQIRSQPISDLIANGLADPEPDVRATFQVIQAKLEGAPAHKRVAWERSAQGFADNVLSHRLEIIRAASADIAKRGRSLELPVLGQ